MIKLRDQRPPIVHEAYDEESCRDFLVHELGFEIPGFFRYAEGIHEVQKRLILRYGDKDIARAMGVFRELLEDDDASGLGDDGDMWRSWRHDHKHRSEDLSNPGTPKFPGMILPSPVPRSRRVTAMSRSYDDPQQPLRSAQAEDDSCIIQIGLSVAADDPRRYSRSVQLSQPSEAAWLAQTYGGAPKDYEGDFEDRVNKTNNSQNISTTANKQENQPLRRSSMRKLVAKRVSTMFNKDGKDGKGKGESFGASRSNKVGTRGRRPEIPPLSFDGAGDVSDDCSPVRTQDIIAKSTSSPGLHLPSICVDGAADETDNFQNLHSVNLNRALPSLPATTRQPLTSTIHSNTPSLVYSGASAAHHSTGSTVASSTNRSTTSSRHDFRNIARDLITPITPEFSPDLQPILDPLDPEKFSPASTGNSHEMGDATTRYMSIATANPFNHDRQTKWPVIHEDESRLLATIPFSATDNIANKPHHKPKGMSHSRSENSVAFITSSNPKSTSRLDVSTHKQTGSYSRLGESGSSPLPSPTRGRASNRAPSPIKYIEDTGEELMIDIPQSPTKRPRSPMKKMFGENGWLGRSTSMKELPSEQYRKTGLKHWGGKIKQRVGDLTEDVTKLLPNPFSHEYTPSKGLTMSKFPVSLDPPTQAKLYSEIELMICATANQYLMTQRREGRMSVESLVKITSFWASRGRPQVIEFQFDQSTQRDLILYNLKTFRFYGEHAENAVSLNSMMYNWKTVAKEMAVRTFCTPDSVVRKHMHDVYKILEMLGAPLVTFLAFQEIQVKALKMMREEQKNRDEAELVQYGVERVWNPPERVTTKVKNGNGELDGSFEG